MWSAIIPVPFAVSAVVAWLVPCGVQFVALVVAWCLSLARVVISVALAAGVSRLHSFGHRDCSNFVRWRSEILTFARLASFTLLLLPWRDSSQDYAPRYLYSVEAQADDEYSTDENRLHFGRIEG